MLNDLKEDINLSNYSIGQGIEHDIEIPALGKFNNAVIEKQYNGIYELKAEIIRLDKMKKLTNFLMNDCFEYYSEIDTRPFKLKEIEQEKITISIDKNDFENISEFYEMVSKIDKLPAIKSELLIRKSHVPIPEIIVTAFSLFSYLDDKKVFDPLLKRMGEDLNKIYIEIRNILIEFSKKQFKSKIKPRCVFLTNLNNIQVELLVFDSSLYNEETIETFLSQLKSQKTELEQQINDFNSSLPIIKIQYKYIHKKFIFCSALGNNGSVIVSNRVKNNIEKIKIKLWNESQ